jgi:hypothetical protein
MSAMDLEGRIERLEHDYEALEWMEVYLAGRNLMKEPAPGAAAEALKQDVETISPSVIQAALEKGRRGGVNDRLVDHAAALAGATTSLARQIVEEVNDQRLTLPAEPNPLMSARDSY